MCSVKLTPDEIHGVDVRSNVVLLHDEFAGIPLDLCYYWYLYMKKDYEATRFELQELSNSGENHAVGSKSMSPTMKKQSPDGISLGVFPAEIWQIACSYLEFEDLSTLRLTNSGLADIAAETMITRVRIDLSFESLERLGWIAEHEHFRKGVTWISFESGLLAPMGCIHRYLAHYDMDHHANMKPQPPGKKASPQAQRLYKRNLAKFTKELEVQFAKYRQSFEAQQCVLAGPYDRLFKCIDNFANLQIIELCAGKCPHVLSRRFIERYGEDCAVSIRTDPKFNAKQLQNIVRPGITELRAASVASTFFDGKGGRERKWLQSVYEKLECHAISIDSDEGPMSGPLMSPIEMTNLCFAISAATNLKYLDISAFTPVFMGNLFDIIPQGVQFHQLKCVGFSNFVAEEDALLEWFQMQPELITINIEEVRLSTGNWRDLFRRLRNGTLCLKRIFTTGLLIDSQITLDTSLYDADAWADGMKVDLSSAIDFYVTDHPGFVSEGLDEAEFELIWNPVNRFRDSEFSSMEDLVDDYGLIDEDMFLDAVDLAGGTDDDWTDEDEDGTDEALNDESVVSAGEESNPGDDAAMSNQDQASATVSEMMDVD